MTRTLVKNAPSFINQELTLQGWVQSRRNHGNLIFVDLRDHTGIIQLVLTPEFSDVFTTALSLRDEFVISATGVAKERSEALKNNTIDSGSIEITVHNLVILNRSETLPIQPFAEAQANEELRLKYRYLDLRRPKMQHTLKRRAEMLMHIRHYMESQEFTEVTTPILANSSPEGARDFLIPSRLHEGKYYALPQAPQQFKQLLMVGGLSRYYQIAACFRDEDPRADRLYGEFYQLDAEMSFVEDGEMVRTTFDPLIKEIVTNFAGKHLINSDIPRISYRDAIETYGTDKPDLRYDMKLTEVTDIFQGTNFAVFKDTETIKTIVVKNGASLSRKQIDTFTETVKSEGAGGLPYLIVENDTFKGPVAKFLSDHELSLLKQRTGVMNGDVIFFGADKRSVVNKVLGRLRIECAELFNLKDPSMVALCWIVDFPFYEWDEGKQRVDFGHNPFSMPKGGAKALNVKSDQDKLAILADQYDMVMNGYEICSGGVRNHNPDILYAVFKLLGYSQDYVETKFGAMLSALKYGAPPHAGCAFGIDRMFMELMGEQNIREVVAFPKNGSGVDLMMSSPSFVEPAQLEDLGL